MTVRTIEYLLNKFGAGKSPGSSEYVDLIDTLADDRNAVYFSATAPADTAANPLWFNTSTNVLSVYDGEWITTVGATGATGATGAAGAAGATGATGPGVATGGTTGQYLVKTDGTNYNTQWSTLDLSGKQDVVANVSSTEIGYLDGVTSAIQTQIDSKLATATATSTYAPLASPALTGTPTAPLATTGTNTTQVATTSFVQQELSILTTGAPAALNTLDELAAALGDDANYAASITTALGAKAPIASPTFTGTVTVPTLSVTTTATGITKSMVGLSNVDNTTDAGKPVSTAQQTALDLKANLVSPTLVTPVLGSATGTSLGLTVASGTEVPLTIQNNGTGNSFIVNDVASDTTPFVINADGNVGIGASSPTNKLDVTAATGVVNVSSSTGTNYAKVQVNNTGGSFQFAIENSAGSNFGVTAYSRILWNDGAHPLVFTTSSTERMRIDSSGRVAIGTSSPAGSLIVKAVDGTANGQVILQKYIGTAASPTESLDWPDPVLCLRGYGNYTLESMLSFGYSNDANYQTTDAVWNFRLDGVASATTSSSSTNLKLGGPGALVIGTAGTERMRIDSSGNTTINTIADGTTSTAAVGAGYMGVPQNSTTTGAYGVVAADAGKHIYSTATRTITIPANASVAFPVGTAISFIAATGTTVTIAITSDTLLLAGAGTTGSRTLAPFGMATAIKITSTSWIISGNGLT